MKTYDEWKSSRKRIMSDGFTSKKLVKIHDNAKETTICNLCGALLVDKSPTTGGVKVLRRHWHLNYPGFFYVNLCEDPRACYNTYIEKGGN